MIDAEMEFFIDPSRCIGCQACFHACAECDTHRGTSMIHLEYADRAEKRSPGLAETAKAAATARAVA